jgi:hypothetical protein
MMPWDDSSSSNVFVEVMEMHVSIRFEEGQWILWEVRRNTEGIHGQYTASTKRELTVDLTYRRLTMYLK